MSRAHLWGTAWAVIAVAILMFAFPTPLGPTHAGPSSDPASIGTPAGGSAAMAQATASLNQGAGPSGGQDWSCTEASGTSTRSCAGPMTRPSGSSQTWTYGGPGPQVNVERFSSLMSYDAADGYVVLLDGFGPGAGPTSTWMYAGNHWTPLNLSIDPVGCRGSGMVYDSGDHYVLMLEGANCTAAGTTWTFVHGGWTQHSLATSPVCSAAVALADDPASGDVVLFGGGNYAGSSSCSGLWSRQTWSYHGGVWANMTPQLNQSPSAREFASMAYDSEGGYLVLFGGANGSGELNDTWEFRAGQWVSVHPVVSPPVRADAALVDDPIIGRVVLVGGFDYQTATSDNWAFQNGSWTLIASGYTAFNPFVGVTAAFDPAASGLLAEFIPVGTSPDVQIWEYSAGAWTNLTEPDFGGYAASLTYDTADGYVLLYDGATWTYTSGLWTRLPTVGGPGSAVPMTYDASDGYVLAYGGPSNTWEYVGGTWTYLTPSKSPPTIPISIPEIAYDPLEGYVLFYSGLNVTWAFRAGSWTNLTSAAGSPPGLPASPLIYDPAAGGVVLVDSWAVSGSTATPVNGTWEFSSGSWSKLNLTTPFIPPSAGIATTAYDSSTGGVLLFETGATWQFLGGAWTEVSYPSSSTPLKADSLVGDPSTGEVLSVGAGEWWIWGSAANSSFPVVTLFAASPNPVEVGQELNITVTASGGTPPLSYAYSGLPSGCSSINSSLLSCRPVVAGPYGIAVVVTDANGNASTGDANLLIVPGPTVSFDAVPSTIAVGHRTLLEATASDGIPPYTYAYSNLPDGCSTQDVPTLPCVPALAGNISVHVLVTDAGGLTASAAALLSVVPSGSTGAPAITAFGAVPSDITLGNGTTISVVASEGSIPLSYSYGGLPSGCPGGNVSTFTCTPAVAGAYLVTVGVTDPSGKSAQANLDLNVEPAGARGGPYVLSFQASPSTIPLGNSTIFLVVPLSESNGSGAVAFSFYGLPVGCASANATRLACAPRAVGSFTVTVVAVNTLGNRTSVSTVLTVSRAPTTNGRGTTAFPIGWVQYVVLATAAAAGVAVVWGLDRRGRERRRLEGNRWIEELTQGDRPEGGPPRS